MVSATFIQLRTESSSWILLTYFLEWQRISCPGEQPQTMLNEVRLSDMCKHLWQANMDAFFKTAQPYMFINKSTCKKVLMYKVRPIPSEKNDTVRYRDTDITD
jgi:hypothetical protein